MGSHFRFNLEIGLPPIISIIGSYTSRPLLTCLEALFAALHVAALVRRIMSTKTMSPRRCNPESRLSNSQPRTRKGSDALPRTRLRLSRYGQSGQALVRSDCPLSEAAMYPRLCPLTASHQLRTAPLAG